MSPEVAFACDAMLGEGAAWDPARGCLWWVDILGHRLFRGNPLSGAAREWKFDTEIGAAPAGRNGTRVLVLRNRVESFEPESSERRLLWQGSERPGNRFNDAAVDAQGCLWIGSMDFDAEAPTGQLWRLSPHGTTERTEVNWPVVNGPVFSPDGRTLFLADTMAGRVLAFELDPSTGRLGAARPFLDLGRFGGLADGMAVDADGGLWVARITTGRVTRYRPDGVADLTVVLPVPMVTSLAFGGADLRTLYMTTARILLNSADLDALPLSGSVFAVRTPTPGQLPHSFGQLQ